MSNISYRPEIDGLRSIAVLSVLIYHAEFFIAGKKIFPGGFFGVDVFFVISGFLITAIIKREYQLQGAFSVAGFYERRVRRLLPALLLVMLATLPVAWFILLPSQIVDFSKSLIASLFFSSNFYWHVSLQEYGAESALLKPFLHTWSLAVEEQFYLIYPVLLVSIYKWRLKLAPYLISIAAISSFVAAILLTQYDQSLSFYMLPSRFWELLAGALLTHISPVRQGGSSLLYRMMPKVGIGLILYSLLALELDANHPGINTVFPVIGTALIIVFASNGEIVTRILSSKPFVFIGLISYSLYLWHYPIFAFGRLADSTPELDFKIVWLVLSFALSTTGYFLIEKPLRSKSRTSLRVFANSTSVAAVLVVAFCAYSIATGGSGNRLSGLAALYPHNDFDNRRLSQESWAILNTMARDQGFGPSSWKESSTFENSQDWYSSDKDTTKVLVVGDSRGKDLFNALYLNRQYFTGTEFARYGLANALPLEQVAVLRQAPNYLRANTIILSVSVHEETLDRMRTVLAAFLQDGKIVLLSSVSPKFSMRENMALFDWYMQKRPADTVFSAQELAKLYYQHLDAEFMELDIKLAALARQAGVTFLNRLELTCSAAEASCTGITPEGYKIYNDDVHWTVEGARYFGQKIYETDWLHPDVKHAVTGFR